MAENILGRHVGANLRVRPDLGRHIGLPLHIRPVCHVNHLDKHVGANLRVRPDLGRHIGLPLHVRPDLGRHIGLPLHIRPDLGRHIGLPLHIWAYTSTIWALRIIGISLPGCKYNGVGTNLSGVILLRKKRKWQTSKPSLRERVESQEERRRYGQLFAETDSEYRQMLWEELPVKMLKPLQEHLFQKTVAAILVVICLGLFSLLNLPLTNRITAAIHYLTVHQANPAELVQTAKPVIQSVRDFNWRRTAAPPPAPGPADEQPQNETMAAPVNGVVKRAYGQSLNLESGQMEMHYGIDVAAAAGSSVFAAFSGTVSLIKGHPEHGLTVYLEHPGNIVTIYGRVSEIAVAAGESVSRGQVIAKVAPTGAGESHLHFEIWENKQPVDPEKYLADQE